MNIKRSKVVLAFGLGLLGGMILYHILLLSSDATIVGPREMIERRERIVALEEENQLMSDALFGARQSADSAAGTSDLPYDKNADARAEIAASRSAAVADQKFLMVTFGANWCRDCRNLHRVILSDEVSAYTDSRFMFVNVNVGKFNKNIAVANELGVSLERGIPVSIFFDPSGDVIGNTNAGELEPARLFTSKQILKFVRDIVERSRVLAPDAVQQP